MTRTGAVAGLFTGRHEHDAGDGFMGGIWNTATFGAALPVSERLTVFAAATAVLHGVHPAMADRIGGPPIVLSLGLRQGF